MRFRRIDRWIWEACSKRHEILVRRWCLLCEVYYIPPGHKHTRRQAQCPCPYPHPHMTESKPPSGPPTARSNQYPQHPHDPATCAYCAEYQAKRERKRR